MVTVVTVVCAVDTARAQASVTQSPVRPLNTDRPDRTESPYSVPLGWLQIESDLVSRGHLDAGDESVTSTSIASFNAKYGVTPRLDLQFVFSPWVHAHLAGPGIDQTTDETGQAGLRAKFNLFGNDTEGSAAGLLPFVFVPTRGSPILDRATWGILAPVTIGATEHASLSSMLGATRVDNDDWWMIASASLGTAITEQLGGFLETYVARAGFKSDALDDVTIDAGVTFAPGDNWQLDTGVYYGVTDDTERWRVFVGASVRWSLGQR